MENQFTLVEKKSLSTSSLIFIAVINACVALSIVCIIQKHGGACAFLSAITFVLGFCLYMLPKHEKYNIELVRMSKLVLEAKKKRRKKRIRVISKIILTISCLAIVISIIYAIYSGLKGS